jgi:hypothetical protein
VKVDLGNENPAGDGATEDGSRTRSELHEQCHHWIDALTIDPGLLITHSYSDLMLAGAEPSRPPGTTSG